MEQQYPSVLLEKAVGEFAKLPGIGRKTALRLILHTLRQSDESVDQFVDAISRLKKEVKYCKVCHNISDTDVCGICIYHLCGGEHPGRDGCGEHPAVSWALSCVGWVDFAYGWHRTCRLGD